MSEQRSNIVLICVDQWRGDCLSAAGHPVVLTPFLDAWSRRGVRFDRAYSATPSCVPARASLFTGMSQDSHRRVGYKDGVPWDYPVTLAGEFTRAGYQTQAVGKMHVYPERSAMGFESVDLHDGYLHFARGNHAGSQPSDLDEIDDYLPWLREQLGRDADYIDNGLECNSIVARPWDKPEYTHPTNWVVTRSIDFLRRRDRERPFFLFASFHRPHPPYDPPAWAFEQYVNEPMPAPPVGDWADAWSPYARPFAADAQVSADLDPRLLQRARAGYYGNMSHIDAQLNRLFTVLGEMGELANTYICFTSDHGELMGDHRLFRKSLPYEGSSRIPFVLTGPGASGIVPGTVVEDRVVELRDVMPTLLDCAGLPVPQTVDGASVLPPARGDDVGWRPYLHGEHTIFDQALHWLTDGREKYVWWSGDGREQLFDLTSDPAEERDLALRPGAKERLATWRKLLVEELTDRPEGFVSAGTLVPGRQVTPVLPG